MRPSATLRRSMLLVPSALLSAAVVLVACGADPDTGTPQGKRLANDYGCLACHTTNGDPGVGPTWKGLYGSQVTLQDGSTVTIDRDYLVRSIVDPSADIPAGTKVPMPVNRVPDADVQVIVDYIMTLK